ncbi:hypothetical protein Dda_5690 [Drechslerella dactyloides]|uniref:AA9 family lytic polysaccharide monooxygenase n=1 Tax=Drechslerella dactyloides TaxID=74499 RepID=A0AAD6IXY8_DREDA|nr:hypothetical protein Dda_5690 [Drechslerella dactyloides]
MLTPSQAITLKVILFVLALAVVCLKHAVRWWLKTRFGWTDILITLTLVLYLAEEIIAIVLFKLNFFDMSVANFSVNGYNDLLRNTEDKSRLSLMLRLLFFSSFVTFTIFWVIKGAFMALYYYLIPPWLTGLRRTINVTSVFVVLSYIGFLVTNVFSCGNVARNWSTDPEAFCFSFSRESGVIYLTTFHLLTDVMIFVIPFFILPHIMLPTAEKFGLTLMFALGLLTISCTIARTAIVLTAESFTYHSLLAWDSGEITCGVIVVCAPSIKWFILWATGQKRRKAIRAFNGQPENSTGGTNLSDMGSGTRKGRQGRAIRREADISIDDDDDEEEEEIKAIQMTCPIEVVVKHEVNIDVESVRASRDEPPSEMVAFSKIIGAAVIIGSASAHTIFQEVWVNGVAQGHLVGVRVPSYDGPISDVTTNDIICNGGLNPLNTPYPSTVINVPSGASITMEWHHTLDSANTGDPADPVDPSHKGPIMAYLAAVPSALQTSVTGLKWFKVYEDGYDPDTNTWAVDKLVKNKGLVTFKLPDCIPSGNYFLRGELIALHGASSNLGAQFYMECAQINIVGGGSASPPTVSFPGAYGQSDPGILINIYYPPVTSYTIPGPRPFTCPGGNNPTTTSRVATTTSRTTFATTARTTAPTTTKPTSTATKPTTTVVSTLKTTTTTKTTTGTTTGTVGAWGQCGGIGYTGPTACVSGYKCSYNNDYYSQCVPA